MFYAGSLKKGLSLVEVMIVLAIMAVFALAVGPRMISYLGNAKIKTTEANLRNVKQAIVAYYGDVGSYPETLSDLMRKPLDDNMTRKWQGPYLEAKNDDYSLVDGWDHDLIYQRGEPGSGKPYELYSYGPNGENGTQEERIYA
jgi:general secretion pathway protein G